MLRQAEVTAGIVAWHPGPIVGAVSPGYSEPAGKTRQRAGIPLILLDAFNLAGSTPVLPQ